MAVGLSTGSGLAAQAGEHPVDVVLGGEWIPRLGGVAALRRAMLCALAETAAQPVAGLGRHQGE
jgi:hypothetical protein